IEWRMANNMTTSIANLRVAFLIVIRGLAPSHNCGCPHSPSRVTSVWLARVTLAKLNSERDVKLSQPLPTQWSGRVPPQQPQVDDSIGRELRVRGGHAGIPCGTQSPPLVQSHSSQGKS